jgi:hypothetical protein
MQSIIEYSFIRRMKSSKSTDSIETEYEDDDTLSLPALSDVFDYIHSTATYKIVTQFVFPITILLLLLKFSRYF